MAAIADRVAGAVESARSLDELDSVRSEVFGRKARLTEIKKSLGGAPADAKPVLGQALGAANEKIGKLIAARTEALEAAAEEAMLAAEGVDLSLPGRRVRHGHRHLISRVMEEMCDVFVGMGYAVAEGPQVESDWYNFEALNIPKSHPSRSDFDTLYVDHGGAAVDIGEAKESEVLMRTHTSPVQVRVMESGPPPYYVVVPGRTFRRDTADATHHPTFHQVEGLAVDRDITFGDLAGTMERFCHEYLGPSFDIRLFPDFFPFTEPSAGLEVWWGGRWLEIAGCGMVDPNVFKAAKVNPDEWQGFAFGFGVERVAMLRYGVDDIRLFYENDIRFLEQFA